MGGVNVLVGDKPEKLVLDQGPADRSASRVTVQLWDLLVRGNVSVLIVEIRGGIQPIRSAVNVSLAVKGIGAGGSAHVDMRAAGRSLLRIVHGSVDTELLNRFRGRRRQCLTDRQIGRRGALNHLRGGTAGPGNAGVIHDAR